MRGLATLGKEGAMKSSKIVDPCQFWLGMFILAYAIVAIVAMSMRGADEAFKVVMVGTAIEAVLQTGLIVLRWKHPSL